MNGLLTSANAMLSTLVLVAARLQGLANFNNRGEGGGGDMDSNITSSSEILKRASKFGAV